MLNTILDALKELTIPVWTIRRTDKESLEAFFIRRRLDLQRSVKTQDYSVTVFQKFQKDGTDMLGASTVAVYPSMTPEEVRNTLTEALHSAGLVGNPYYELYANPDHAEVPSKSGFAAKSLAENLQDTAKAIFAPDKQQDVFVNSVEIFAEKVIQRVLNSSGTDVSWETRRVNGEYVIQCLEPADVETHHIYDLREPDLDALSHAVEDALVRTRDRARATEPPKAGQYTVILSEDKVSTLLSYYQRRSDASMVYQKYSDWAVGQNVQGEEISGDAVSVSLTPVEPFDWEGIPLSGQPLLEKGVLKTIHGGARFSWYLGMKPTGTYSAIQVPSGTVSLEDMKKQPCLHVVTFSDFQMNPFSGYFGGEIRLAYLSDGKDVQVVTGGSVSGNILEAQKHMVFSKERYRSAGYDGPLAVALQGVNVAGKD